MFSCDDVRKVIFVFYLSFSFSVYFFEEIYTGSSSRTVSFSTRVSLDFLIPVSYTHLGTLIKKLIAMKRQNVIKEPNKLQKCNILEK